ncbi:hypothetical protein ACKU07_25090 [Enterobacter hormaechei]
MALIPRGPRSSIPSILMKASSEKWYGYQDICASPQDMSALTVLLNKEESFARAIELITASEDIQSQICPYSSVKRCLFARLDKRVLEPALKQEVLEIPNW